MNVVNVVVEAAVGEIARRIAGEVLNITTESLHVQSKDNATCALAKAKKFLQGSRNDLYRAALSAKVFMDALSVNIEEADEASYRARLESFVENAENHISSFQSKAQKATEQTAEAELYVDTNVVPAKYRNQIFETLKFVSPLGLAAAFGFGGYFVCRYLGYLVAVEKVVVLVGLAAGGVIPFVVRGKTAADPDQPFTELERMSNELSRDATSLLTYATEWESELKKLKTSLSCGGTNLESFRMKLNELREKVVTANNKVERIIENLWPHLHPERNNV